MRKNLFQLVEYTGSGELAVVGMTKNVGKTVTLNYLVKRYALAGKNVGLVSAGYDGERFDRLTMQKKPRIHAPAGALVATASACFEAADAGLVLLQRSSQFTPLGEVLVGRVKKAGLVELAGPASVGGLKKLIAGMREHGADRILVDGAVNRLASASPEVAGGTILATGAAVAPLLEDVIRKTLFRSTILEMPAVEEEALRDAAAEGLGRGEAALIHRNREGPAWEIEPVRAELPLLAGALLRERCRKDTAAAVLGGALVDRLLEDMTELTVPPVLIVQDATRIFVTPDPYQRFVRRGGRIRVLRRVNLVAVTLNPTDPLGKGYPPRDFKQAVAEALAPRPVFDLVLEEGART